MPNRNSLTYKLILSAVISLMGVGTKTYAFPSDFYTPSSVLGEGTWAKIEVEQSGMQFISDATIRSLGFSQPEKVNVYGYGGEVIPETLNSPDDLPLVASQRVNGGIIFFGKGNVGWETVNNNVRNYKHLSHPYSDNSYYFLSDAPLEEGDRKDPLKGETLEATPGKEITVFTERIVHEQDLWMPMNTGRLMLGEDFKTQTSRNFQFNLIGNTGDAIVTTAFGCKTSAGTASITLTANGKQLPATTEDRMAFSATKEIVTTETSKEVGDPGERLDLTIKYNGSGTTTKAGLNYIEIEYPRALKITTGELYFYLKPDAPSTVMVEGATNGTVVWDVTDPLNAVAMPATLSGSTLTFTSASGYREYVAFEPSRISRAVSPAGKIANQDIHAMSAPDMVVISPAEYISAAQRLVTLHTLTDGLEVAVVTPEQVYNEFSSGKPDVSAFRKMLKMWYDRAGENDGKYTKYCLIMSRPTYDNKKVSALVKNCGYPRVLIYQSPTGETETTSYSTDDYIGMLEDVKGGFNIGTAVINTAVGRMPVRSLSEANMAIDKLENYLLRPDLGAWRNNVIVIADDQDNGVHLQQAENVMDSYLSTPKGNDFIFEKLYLDSYKLEYSGVGAVYPQAKERLLSKWNEGTAYIDYIGHANPKGWGHENLFTWTDINSMSNSRLPFIYAATCEFMRWDDDEVSGGEVLWLLPNSGVIGMICPSREVLISANGTLNKFVAKYVFETDEEGNALAVGDVMRLGKNESNTGTNKLRYGIMGDPSMRLPWPNLKMNVTEINGIEIEGAEDFPVLPARSKATVSGTVTDQQGNILEDFNGIAEISLYDAEKVVTTNGNGSDGVVSEYNDRKTRLFVGRAKVVEGKWTTSFTMPSEIENNYSPAKLSLYASDDQLREANGSCTKLYAYGYDQTAPEDFNGPKIIEFYLNTPTFVSGSQVSPNPVLKAVFYDESGISVSEAGIGHNITLDLDGKKYYEDVAQYFLPDENESGKGSLTYSLGEIGEGDHTLRFTVWDNANNSTTATLDFSISALWKPTIETLTTDVNPDTSSVNFIVVTDGVSSTMECTIDVYDIWGRRVWRDVAPSLTGHNNRTTLNWDLNDFGGARVAGGIYLYRATVKMENGATVAKTKKLIVAD